MTNRQQWRGMGMYVISHSTLEGSVKVGLVLCLCLALFSNILQLDRKSLSCVWPCWICSLYTSQIARFMGPTWGPPGSCHPQVGPMLAPWILLSGLFGAAWCRVCQLCQFIRVCGTGCVPASESVGLLASIVGYVWNMGVNVKSVVFIIIWRCVLNVGLHVKC